MKIYKVERDISDNLTSFWEGTTPEYATLFEGGTLTEALLFAKDYMAAHALHYTTPLTKVSHKKEGFLYKAYSQHAGSLVIREV